MVVPSKRWFPTNLPARAAWFQNFYDKFSDVATTLGFNAMVLTNLELDNQIMQFLNTTMTQLDTYKSAVVSFNKIITEGEIGKPTPVFPANETFTPPADVATGIFERLVKLVERIKVAPAYTDEIGALLGILPVETGSVSPENVKPSIKAFASASGYEFSIVVSDREKATQWNVEILRDGQTEWQTIKTATGKSVDTEIQPTIEGKPERIQVRVRLIKNNEDYGQPSDPTFVTLNP